MIYVCNLEDMPRHVEAVRPSHLVSVITAEYQPPTPPGIAVERHLRIACDDIVDALPGHVCPGAEHVEMLVEFARGWDRAAPMLVHCHAGVSRSMAAALTASVLHTRGDEASLAARLRAAAPHAQPNRRMVALADEILGRAGRLIAAVEAMGPAEPLAAATLVELRLDDLDQPRRGSTG